MADVMERSDLIALVVSLEHQVQRLADAAQARVAANPDAARSLESALVGLVDVTRGVATVAGMKAYDPLVNLDRDCRRG